MAEQTREETVRRWLIKKKRMKGVEKKVKRFKNFVNFILILCFSFTTLSLPAPIGINVALADGIGTTDVDIGDYIQLADTIIKVYCGEL